MCFPFRATLAARNPSRFPGVEKTHAEKFSRCFSPANLEAHDSGPLASRDTVFPVEIHLAS